VKKRGIKGRLQDPSVQAIHRAGGKAQRIKAKSEGPQKSDVITTPVTAASRSLHRKTVM
jgi:hypothetical protein